jgi:hypothetical protein
VGSGAAVRRSQRAGLRRGSQGGVGASCGRGGLGASREPNRRRVVWRRSTTPAGRTAVLWLCGCCWRKSEMEEEEWAAEGASRLGLRRGDYGRPAGRRPPPLVVGRHVASAGWSGAGTLAGKPGQRTPSGPKTGRSARLNKKSFSFSFSK